MSTKILLDGRKKIDIQLRLAALHVTCTARLRRTVCGDHDDKTHNDDSGYGPRVGKIKRDQCCSIIPSYECYVCIVVVHDTCRSLEAIFFFFVHDSIIFFLRIITACGRSHSLVMKDYIMQNARQVIALASIGAGTLLFRTMNQSDNSCHPTVANLTYVKRHPNVSRIIVRLDVLEQPQLVDALAQCLDGILEISDALATESVLKRDRDEVVLRLNRLTTQANQIIQDILYHSKRTDDDEVFRQSIYCAQDEIPTLSSILESVLHNAILDSK